MTHPLSGYTVIECGVAVAGPLAARYLAHLGAEVIKVDSRGTGGFSSAPRWAPKDVGLAGLDLGAGSTLNGEKLSVGLDLKAPAGREALARLAAKSDVFLTNLSVPAIESLRITYADLQRWNPRIVYISMTGFGDGQGPYRQYRSWGPNLSALSGLDFLTGDADRPPVMHPSPFPDHGSAFHAVAAVLSALIDRAATGEGQEIRMAQLETTVNVLGPDVLAAQLSGVVPMRRGNRDPLACPRGLFPCRGNDRWVAIEVRSDDEWRALCAVDGVPPALRVERFGKHEGRLAHEDDLEALVAEWTAGFTNREVALRLQSAGVAANPVQSAWDHVTDPQLEARGFWRVVGNDRFGTDISSRLPMQFSATPPRYTQSAPSFGHDTRTVLRERAGLSAEEVERMVEAGAAEVEAPLPPHIDAGNLERPSRRWAWPLLRVFDHAGDDGPAAPHPSTAVAGAAAVPLSECRVLDLSDELSVYGTRLLALLGAEVIRVEAPGGAVLRQHPPLHEGKSLFQRYMDAGKSSVTVDLESGEGRARFEELVRSADVVYESKPPGYLEGLGIGWARIREVNPTALLVSVTPFGQTGPFRDWKAGELGLWALSGSLPLTGYPDRRPVAPGGGLGLSFVGANGAIAALAGMAARQTTGAGQWIDVSAHEVLVFTAGGMLVQIDDMAERGRSGVRALGTGPYGYYTCSDRLVCLLALMPPHWDILAAWIHEKTGDADALNEEYRGSGASRYRFIDEVDKLVNSLARQYGADEFCKEAQRRGVPAMPVNSIADLLVDPHLAATGFWQELKEPGEAPIRWPGPPFRMPGARLRAP